MFAFIIKVKVVKVKGGGFKGVEGVKGVKVIIKEVTSLLIRETSI